MTGVSPQPLQIFLSYAREDWHHVNELHRRLTADGFSAWIDKEALIPGQAWESIIDQAVERADVVLICLSNHSIGKRGFVQTEINLAIEAYKKQPEDAIFLIPVRLEQCKLPYSIKHLHALNYYESQGYDKLRRALTTRAEQLGKPIGQPQAPPLEQVQADIAQGRFTDVVANLTLAAQRNLLTRNLAAILAEIAENSAAPLFTRIEAARLVGQTGDLRLPCTTAQWAAAAQQCDHHFARGAWDESTPPAYWRYIPSNTYQIGVRQPGTTSARLKLHSFWIARFPITVAQYTPYVQAVGHAPWRWGNPKFHGANQPVIGVTWREAVAYCEWLTRQLAADLPPDHVIRLPTEAEWEIAAAYTREGLRCTYPWGEEALTTERAVYALSKVQAPLPVGCCPAGEAACGALDLAGNVWELTLSDWHGFPRQSHRPLNQELDRYVAWRGGSWFTTGEFVASSSRGWIDIDTHTGADGGFRVALAPHL